MTGWKLTIRTAPGALVAAEYHCPMHGRFALDVAREANGDPPANAPCPWLETGWIKVTANYEIAAGQDTTARPCGLVSPFVISAPGTAKVRRVEAVRGGYQKAEHTTWTDTTNLGEGQDLDDWRADRAKVWEREREREAMEMAREL